MFDAHTHIWKFIFMFSVIFLIKSCALWIISEWQRHIVKTVLWILSEGSDIRTNMNKGCEQIRHKMGTRVKSSDGFGFVFACKCSAYRFNIVITLIDTVFGSDFVCACVSWKHYHWRFTAYIFKCIISIELSVLFFFLSLSLLHSWELFFSTFFVLLSWIEETQTKINIKSQSGFNGQVELLVKVDRWYTHTHTPNECIYAEICRRCSTLFICTWSWRMKKKNVSHS